MATAEQLAKISASVAAEVKPVRTPVAQEPVVAAPEAAEEQEAQAAPEQQTEQSAAPTQSEADRATATKRGWLPKDDWVAAGKDPDDWVSHKVFLRNGETYNDMHTLKRKLSTQDRVIREQAEINRQISEKFAKDRIGEKLQQRDMAIEIGDKNTVKRIDGEIEELKQMPVAPPEIQLSPDQRALMGQWIQDRPWMQKNNPEFDPDAYEAALKKYGVLEAQNREDVERNLSEVDKYISKRNGYLYREGTQPQPQTRKLSQVAAPSNNAAPKRAKDKGFGDLPDMAKKVALEIERAGGLKREEYAKSYHLREQVNA